MNQLIRITSISDPRIEKYSRLTEAQLRNRLEPEEGILIAESTKVICTALKAGLVPISFLMSEKHYLNDAAQIVMHFPNVPVYTGEEELLEHITGYRVTRSVLCAMKRPFIPSPDDFLKSSHRIAVLENIVDSTNLGAIFRSAAALGVDGILLTPNCCDPFVRRTVRVSMGTVFQIQWAYLAESYEKYQRDGINLIKDAGFHTVAMALKDQSIPLDDPKLKEFDKLAIVMGTEGEGLSDFMLKQCDDTAIIPMMHGVDSLNVAAASAVAFWELRKR